jgi:hypothetical protein
MFKVIRLDGMVLIIPRKFVEELRSLPEHHLSLRHLQVYVSVFSPGQSPTITTLRWPDSI